MAKGICFSVGRRFSRRIPKMDWFAMSRGCLPSKWMAKVTPRDAGLMMVLSEPGWSIGAYMVPWYPLSVILCWGVYEGVWAYARGMGADTSKQAACLSIIFDIWQAFIMIVKDLVVMLPVLGIATLLPSGARIVWGRYIKAMGSKRGMVMCKDKFGHFIVDMDPMSPFYKQVLGQEVAGKWVATETMSPHHFIKKKWVVNRYQEQPHHFQVPIHKEVMDKQYLKDIDFHLDTDLIRVYNKEIDRIELVRVKDGEVVHIYNHLPVIRATKGWKYICAKYKPFTE